MIKEKYGSSIKDRIPRAVYHITYRGNERKTIFQDDHDRNAFLEILEHSLGIYNIREGHPLRSVFIEILYRAGGLTGKEIGKVFGVDYSTVSQIRKKSAARLQEDSELKKSFERIEREISKQKN